MNIHDEVKEVMKWYDSESTTDRICEAKMSVLHAVVTSAKIDENGISGETSTYFSGSFAGMVVMIDSIIDVMFSKLSEQQKKLLALRIMQSMDIRIDGNEGKQNEKEGTD